MKKAWKTTEFWAALITNLIGIVMLSGYVNAAEGEELGNALKAIAGAVISLVSTVGYMHERTELKKTHLAALMNSAALDMSEEAQTAFAGKIKAAGL